MKRLLQLFGITLLVVIVMAGVAGADTETLRITSQPADISVTAGSTANFTVTATTTAKSISYQWQYRKDASSAWASSGQSGNKTATLSVAATAGLDGYQFRCVVKDSSGTMVYSNAATLRISPRITTQPVSKTVAPGTTATFTVAATGTGTLTYQWQYRKDSDSSWAASGQTGNKTTTLSVTATNGLHGYQFRCIITDSGKRKAYTNVVTLSVSPRITTQPVSKTVAPGTTATFTVAATGTGTLTYQWQYRKDANSSWASSGQSGNKTATLSVAATKSLHGYQFRCVITDGSKRKAYTNVVTLSVSPRITTQPVSKTVAPGTTAAFTVAVAGTGSFTYQWQYRKDANSAWAASGQSGSKTATISVAATTGLNGYQFRCVIKDGSNRVTYSNVVTLYVTPKITTQPVSKTVAPGSTATFTVAASGKGTITYQWQYRENSTASWANSGQNGNKTPTLSVTATNGLHGYQFRCVVTHGTGQKVYSNGITLSVSPRIMTQPVDECVTLGATATFAVTAAGTGSLTYQWQYMSPTMTTWANSGQSGNKTAKLSVKTTASLQGYRFRCVITDGNGWKVYTKVVTLTLCDIPINEMYFPDPIFRKYVKDNFDTTRDGKLSKEEILAVDSIIARYSKISNMKGVEFFSELTKLICDTNDLNTLDVSKNTALKELNCSENNLTAIDVRKNTALEHLNCGENKLTALDVSKNKMLQYLFCTHNYLTMLDVSNNTALMTLDCTCNNLKSLDVSMNTSLTYLYCDSNSLTTLNVSGCAKLKNITCTSNNLTSLDVSKSTELEYIRCYSNNLKTMDVRNNTELWYFDCHGNSLSTLKVSKNTRLKTLHCYGNNLTALELSGCTGLQELYCSNNNLTMLDVSKNLILERLQCSINNLTTLVVGENTNLKSLECSSNSLTSLSTRGCSALKNLNCVSNNLSTLDVNGCTKLTLLECYYNELNTIEVSMNTELTVIDIIRCDEKVNVIGADSRVQIIRY